MQVDYIIIQANGEPLRHNGADSDIIVYGDGDEALDDLYQEDLGMCAITYDKTGEKPVAKVHSLDGRPKSAVIGEFTYDDSKEADGDTSDFQRKLTDFIAVCDFAMSFLPH